MQAELLAKEAELQSASAASQKVLEEAEGRATSARREAEQWSREAEDRRMQLSVLMETMETLQTGSLGQPLSCSLYLYVPAPIAVAVAETRTRRTTGDDSSSDRGPQSTKHLLLNWRPTICTDHLTLRVTNLRLKHLLYAGDKEQRVISLTARFAAARLKEAAAVRRADDLTREAAAREDAAAQLHTRLEAAERQLAQLRADLDVADRHAAQLTAELDSANSNRDTAVQDLAAAKAQLLLQEEVLSAAAAETEQRVLQAEQALSAAEAELVKAREEADRQAQQISHCVHRVNA
jgi:hypothetical protein